MTLSAIAQVRSRTLIRYRFRIRPLQFSCGESTEYDLFIVAHSKAHAIRIGKTIIATLFEGYDCQGGESYRLEDAKYERVHKLSTPFSGPLVGIDEVA